MKNEPIMAGQHEKTTSPVVSTQGQQPIDDDAPYHVSALLSQPTRRGFFRRIAQAFSNYLTALLLTLPVFPIFASVVTVSIYLTNVFELSWNTVLYSMLCSYAAWCIITLFLVPLTSARNSNARSYGLLYSRFRQLVARLNVINDQHHANQQQPLPEYQEIALQEAFDKFDDLNSELHDNTVRLPWLMGFGYVNAWTKLHRAEEALIEVEPIQMVMRGAMHDKLAISDSQIHNRDEVLGILRHAVATLDRSARDLKFSDFLTDEKETHELEKDIEKQNIKQSESNDTSSSKNERDEALTRIALREIRRTLNEYRDRLWESLIHVRNNLWGTIFITGLITYILLCIAILSVPLANGRTAIIAVAAFYMVGAIAGLFGAIRRESMTDPRVDDYGLTFAHLIFTPLLSGLAGVGGVLIVSLLFETFFIRQTTYSLQNIFQLTSPNYLIVSAFFGFLSHLVSGNLQARAGQYISALGKDRVENKRMDQLPMYSASDRQLEQVFNHDLRQARQWSGISAVTAIVGLLLILGGVVSVLIWNVLIGFVIAIAGGVIESVAAFSLQKVKMANNLLDNSSESIREGKKSKEEPLVELLKL